MSKGQKTGHVWFDAEDMRQARKVAAYWRRWLLLPHTKVHIRRGHRVVVNLYTLLEALWFMCDRCGVHPLLPTPGERYPNPYGLV